MNKIREIYVNLSDREQKLVKLAGILVAFIIMYSVLKNLSFVFNPSLNVIASNTKNEYLKLQPKIQELQKLQLLQQNHKNISNGNLFKYISENPPKIATEGDETPEINSKNDKVEIVYKSVSFDDLILWLGRQNKQYGITVVSANIQKNIDQNGYVSATLLLE